MYPTSSVPVSIYSQLASFMDPLSHTNFVPPIGKSSGTKYTPPHLKDYVCQLSHQSSNNTSISISYPISNFLSNNKFSNAHIHFSLSLITHTEPKSYVEASKFDCWNKAMKFKHASLEQNRTWKLVDVPPNIKPIGSIWVHDDGTSYDILSYVFSYFLCI